MSESETEMTDESNDEENAETEETYPEVSFDELSEEDKEILLNNPEVQKTLRYGNSRLSQIAPMTENFTDEDTDAYELLVSDIAERNGRVTEQTVEKVLQSIAEAYNDVVN